MCAMFKNIKLTHCVVIVLASAFLAFGLYNVHSISDVTEGGILGMTLLLHRWFSISPAISGFVLNALCYLYGLKTLGKKFLSYSAISAITFSIAYRIFESYPPLWPQLYYHPFVASVLGALFVGIGVGVCVLIGGAPSGDDALAMSLSSTFKIKIEYVYLASDLIVLALSLTYIPATRIIFSLITVILSGQIIGYVQRLSFF